MTKQEWIDRGDKYIKEAETYDNQQTHSHYTGLTSDQCFKRAEVCYLRALLEIGG